MYTSRKHILKSRWHTMYHHPNGYPEGMQWMCHYSIQEDHTSISVRDKAYRMLKENNFCNKLDCSRWKWWFKLAYVQKDVTVKYPSSLLITYSQTAPGFSLQVAPKQQASSTPPGSHSSPGSNIPLPHIEKLSTFLVPGTVGWQQKKKQ